MKLIPNLFHILFHYTEVAAIFQFLVLLLLFGSVPIVFPAIFKASSELVLFISICIIALIIAHTRSSAQGPDAQWFKMALKNTGQDKENPPQLVHSRAFYGMSCVVTGASYPGIGFYTAKYLSALGFRVILVCRDVDKGEEARLKILEDDNFTSVRVVIGDLKNLNSIKNDIVPDILDEARGTWLALVVNNAGVALNKSKMVPLYRGGENKNVNHDVRVDETLLVNYLAPYLLTDLLLPSMMDYWKKEELIENAKKSVMIKNNNNSSMKEEEEHDEKKKQDQENLIRPKMWFCTRCLKQKEMHHVHESNDKSTLYSDCSHCGVKTKFDAATTTNVTLVEQNKTTSEKEQEEEEKKIQNDDDENEYDLPATDEENELSSGDKERIKRIGTTLGFPRVVNVSSLFHLFGQDPPRNFENDQSSAYKAKTAIEKHLDLLTHFDAKFTVKTHLHPSPYSFSKLCSVMHSVNIARKFAATQGVVALSLHPGMVRTKIWDGNVGALTKKFFSFLFFKSPSNGAQTSLHCCTGAVREIRDMFHEKSMNGKYFADCAEVGYPFGSPACSTKELDSLELWTRKMLREYLE